MLQKTFCHVKGISLAFEKTLWDSGIGHWDDFLTKSGQLQELSQNKKEKITEELLLSQKALAKNDLQYFKNTLPPKEHWRLAGLGKTAFVDIETTGLSKWADQITVLGIYDGIQADVYVQGKDLPQAKDRLKEFDIIVTFNGKQFDVPFIEHHFTEKYDFIHLDLRYMLKELGYQGGLKVIERQLGIQRDTSIQNVDGFEAVHLWHRYKRGNLEALNKLVEYNKQDIVSLEKLLEHYLQNKRKHLLA